MGIVSSFIFEARCDLTWPGGCPDLACARGFARRGWPAAGRTPFATVGARGDCLRDGGDCLGEDEQACTLHQELSRRRMIAARRSAAASQKSRAPKAPWPKAGFIVLVIRHPNKRRLLEMRDARRCKQDREHGYGDGYVGEESLAEGATVRSNGQEGCYAGSAHTNGIAYVVIERETPQPSKVVERVRELPEQ